MSTCDGAGPGQRSCSSSSGGAAISGIMWNDAMVHGSDGDGPGYVELYRRPGYAHCMYARLIKYTM